MLCHYNSAVCEVAKQFVPVTIAAFPYGQIPNHEASVLPSANMALPNAAAAPIRQSLVG